MAAKYEHKIVSIAVDTWGVDFALLGPGDELLGNPYCYCYLRTAGIFEKAFSMVSREDIFAETGLQFMEFNTLYQLLAMRLQKSPLLDIAESFAMIPTCSTAPHWGEDERIHQRFNDTVPESAHPRLVPRPVGEIRHPDETPRPVGRTGNYVIGPVRKSIAEATGLSNVKVVLPGTHHTATRRPRCARGEQAELDSRLGVSQ